MRYTYYLLVIIVIYYLGEVVDPSMADDWMDGWNTEGPDGASRPPTSEAAAIYSACALALSCMGTSFTMIEFIITNRFIIDSSFTVVFACCFV